METESLIFKTSLLWLRHIQGVEYLSDTSKILQVDANGDGLINSYDLEESMKYRFKRQDLPQLPKATILNTSPTTVKLM